MADDFLSRGTAILDRIERENAAAPPSGTVVPANPDDLMQRGNVIAGKAESGTLPSEAQMQGAPPPQPSAADRSGLNWGVQNDSILGPLFRALAPAPVGAGPRPYDVIDAGVHGFTQGGSDVARGYMHDVARGVLGAPGGYEWGRGASDIKDARDAYATQNPGTNLVANAVGGLMLPLPGAAAAGRLIAQIPSAVGRTAATVGLGSGLGALFGGTTGALDELPRGGEAALEGGKQGAALGAALGAAIPAAGAAYTAGRNWWSPTSRAGQEAVNAAQLRGTTGEVAQQGADPAALRATVQQRLGMFDTQAEAQLAAERQAAAAANQRLGAAVPIEERGSDLRAGIEAGKQASKENYGPLYDAIDPNRSFVTNQQPTMAAAQKISEGMAKSAAPMGKEEGEIFGLARMWGANTPFSETTALRTRILDETRRARAAGETVTVGRLTTLRQALDDTISSEVSRAAAGDPNLASRLQEANAPASSPATVPGVARPLYPADAGQAPGEALPPVRSGVVRDEGAPGGRVADTPGVPEVPRGQKAAVTADDVATADWRALEQARAAGAEPSTGIPLDAAAAARKQAADAAYRTHAETYKNPFVGPLLTNAPAGGYRVSDTDIVGRILRNNESAQAFLAAGGDKAALRGALVDDLRRIAPDGILTEKALQAWQKSREGALRAVPELLPDVQTAVAAQSRVDALARAQAADRQAIQRGTIGRLLGSEDVDGAVSTALQSNNAVNEMMRVRQLVAGNPAAEAGLERSIANHIANRFVDAQTGAFNDRGLAQFIQQKRAALAAGMSADGLKTLEAMAQGRFGSDSIFARAIRQMHAGPAAAAGLPAGIATALTVGDVMTTGGVGLGMTVLGSLAGRMRANGLTDANKLMGEVLTNPALGRALAMKAAPNNAAMAEKAVNVALAGARAAPAATVDYGGARQRQQERARRELLTPAR